MNVKQISESEFNTANGAVIECFLPNPNRPMRFAMKKGQELIAIAFKSSPDKSYEFYKTLG